MRNRYFAHTWALVWAVVWLLYGTFAYLGQEVAEGKVFLALSAAAIGLAGAMIPLYLQYNREVTVDHTQLAVLLNELLPRKGTGWVVKKKLAQMRQDIDQMRERIYPINLDLLVKGSEQHLREAASKRKPGSLLAVHIIDSDASAKTWAELESPYFRLDDYVAAQCEFARGGGKLVRLFLFSPKYLAENRALCVDAVREHDARFAALDAEIETLCNEIKDEFGTIMYEFSILGNEEIFRWYRPHARTAVLYDRGEFVTNDQVVEDTLEAWEYYKSGCKTLSEFFPELESIGGSDLDAP